MTKFADIADRDLTWVDSGGGCWAYDLRAGSQRIGSLRFETESGSRAIGELGGRRFLFDSYDGTPPYVVVMEEGRQEPLATFTQRWTGGGIVRFGEGDRFCWNNTHIWSTTYCFRKEGQKASVCLTQEAPSRKGSRVTVCREAAGRPEIPVLILLGWFLEILVAERAAETSVTL